jgi:hypothetical protein
MGKQGIFYDIFDTTEEEWDIDQWREHGVKLKRTEGKGDRFKSQYNWAIGDWLLAGKKKRGVRKTRVEAERILKQKWGTLKNIMGTAKDFPKSRRRDFLYFSHHYLVRKYPEKEQDAWLDRCVEESNRVWSVKGLENALAEAKTKQQEQSWEEWKRVKPIKFDFTPENAAVLWHLFESEKVVHGAANIEKFITWVMIKGMKSAGWESKVQEFAASRKAQRKAQREESARSMASWNAKMDAQTKFVHGLPKDLNHSQYISRLRDWEAAWEKSREESTPKISS